MLERVSLSTVKKGDIKVLLMIQLLPVFLKIALFTNLLKSVFEFLIEFYKSRKVQENSRLLKNMIQKPHIHGYSVNNLYLLLN
jgi:hypothetical protein